MSWLKEKHELVVYPYINIVGSLFPMKNKYIKLIFVIT